jgi:S-DNA-T family DNA segregation ATPase FtsK/SpoIIIE
MARRRRKPPESKPTTAKVEVGPILAAAWFGFTGGTGRLVRAVTPRADGGDPARTPPHDSLGTDLLLSGQRLAAAMWTHPSGPVGAGLRLAAALAWALVGATAYGLPVVQVFIAVQVLRHPDGLGSARVTRQAAGAVMSIAGVAGVAQLLAHAGGLLGRITGGLLAALITAWGAVPLLVLLSLTGLLTATGFTTLPRRRTRPAAVDVLDDLQETLELAPTSPAAAAPAPVAVPPAPSAPPGAAPRSPAARPAAAPADHTGRAPASPASAGVRGGWELPPLTLLAGGNPPKKRSAASDEVRAKLQGVLDEFKVNAKVSDYRRGPAVTRYEITVGPGVKVNKITGLGENFALALGTPNVRILTPIPGKNAVGVEIPNSDPDTVTLGDVVAAYAAWSSRTSHRLLVGLGKDIDGKALTAILAEMPHILIAGATGAGKSGCLNALLTSILTRATPDEVRLLLIDPKRVELAAYAGLPHLVRPIVTDVSKAVDVLHWLTTEMDRRYDALAEARVRNIDDFNRKARAAGEKTLPYLLAVVDEVADLMMVAKAAAKAAKASGEDEGEPTVEELIVRILQLARAAGIHLVLATQRPSVDVVTGLIKANLPVRLAFAVASLADSRVILDTPGAEKLLGRGDALYQPAGASKPVRMQGAWVSDKEIAAVVGFWRRQRPPTGAAAQAAPVSEAVPATEPQATPAAELPEPSTSRLTGVDAGADTALLRQAIELVVSSQFGSTSMLQRKLRIGFAKAGRLMDLLEEHRIVGPSEGSKARDVLVKPDQLPDLLTQLDDAGGSTDGDSEGATVLAFPQRHHS